MEKRESHSSPSSPGLLAIHLTCEEQVLPRAPCLQGFYTFPMRKLEVFDYCLNGARSITAVCPAPGEFSAWHILSIIDGRPGGKRTSSGFLSSNMTNSFQKAKCEASLGGSVKSHLTSKCLIPPLSGLLRPRKTEAPKDAQR